MKEILVFLAFLAGTAAADHCCEKFLGRGLPEVIFALAIAGVIILVCGAIFFVCGSALLAVFQ